MFFILFIYPLFFPLNFENILLSSSSFYYNSISSLSSRSFLVINVFENILLNLIFPNALLNLLFLFFFFLTFFFLGIIGIRDSHILLYSK